MNKYLLIRLGIYKHMRYFVFNTIAIVQQNKKLQYFRRRKVETAQKQNHR